MTISERIESFYQKLDQKTEIIGIYKDSKNFRRYEKLCTKYGDKYAICFYCRMKDKVVECHSIIKQDVIAIFFSRENFLNSDFRKDVIKKLNDLKFNGRNIICKEYHNIVSD